MKKLFSIITLILLTLVAFVGCSSTSNGYNTLKSYILENGEIIDVNSDYMFTIDYSDEDGLQLKSVADYGMCTITINPDSTIHDVSGLYLFSSSKATAATASIDASTFSITNKEIFNINIVSGSYIPSYGTAQLENLFGTAIGLLLATSNSMILELDIGITIEDLGFINF